MTKEIRITCVSAYPTQIKLMKEFCEKVKFKFKSRDYDADTYFNDREYIERLPAYHLYINNVHETTFYPGKHIYKEIEDTISDYQSRIKKRYFCFARIKTST